MIIKIHFIQRKESYPGENAPEARTVVDEYSYSENPEWFKKTIEADLEVIGTDLAGSAVVEIEVPDAAIRAACIPSVPLIKSVVLQSKTKKQQAEDRGFYRDMVPAPTDSWSDNDLRWDTLHTKK